MSLRYITINIPVPKAPDSREIEASLLLMGTPIRWAVTRIEAGQCTVESVVYTPENSDGTLFSSEHPGVKA